MSDRSGDRKEVVRVAPKVVKLHVHKNTKARRRRHELARALVETAKLLSSEKDVEGFAVVVLGTQTSNTLLNNGDMDPDLFMSKVMKELRVMEGTLGLEETDEDDLGG